MYTDIVPNCGSPPAVLLRESVREGAKVRTNPQEEGGAMVATDLKTCRDNLTRSMEEAAKGAGVRLLPGDVAHSMRGDLAISTAFVAPEDGVPLERADKLFFLYVSIPERYQIAKKIPEGYYIAERIAGADDPRVKLVNMKGEAVYELPLHVIKTELPPDQYTAQYGGYDADDGYNDGEEPFTKSQAMIEQSQYSLYRITILTGHGIICYPRQGVWYWTWVVIVIF
jgi:hypothetical protein